MRKWSFAEAILVLIVCGSLLIEAGALIPPRYDGFVFGGGEEGKGTAAEVVIEAFYDPLCPYSRDSWPPLKKAIKHYRSHGVALIVHPFSLPYHDNAFVASRALHIANNLNSSTTYHLLDLFFKKQERFYNKPTRHLSRAAIVSRIAKFATKALGKSSLSDIESAFEDSNTDYQTRISFKYACSRSVIGTPTFIVNGFQLPDDGSDLDYEKWKKIIDSLLSGNVVD
ncbi:hypothetical protein H6P81_018643 [Aristolochia fimbriata]|uniref:Thioredoxin-like fold domain-containing protein n=1 Tax=Aristolochia fimbriata TaxID=158543 RepID=A0AAV7E1W6_ARIFI|nr:hypothetical protein H6P81_018643 [Aristolochia fimbriata]